MELTEKDLANIRFLVDDMQRWNSNAERKIAKIDMNAVGEDIENGYLIRRDHATERLCILNYTEKTQFDKAWTPLREMCRGLIVENDGTIVARPFPKFFNFYERIIELPDGEVEVTDKLDGSLGIMYPLLGENFIASRGSFHSPQANHANEILKSRYSGFLPVVGFTYLFEIIYPENRIVVDYGDTDDLFLLAIINTETGLDIKKESPVWRHAASHFPVAESIPFESVEKLAEADFPNKEGFVVRFLKNNLRVKIKCPTYVRHHKIFSQLSGKFLLEELAESGSLDEILRIIPDELYDWVRSLEEIYRTQYAAILRECMEIFLYTAWMDTRKEKALYIASKKIPYSSIIFMLIDKKDIQAYRTVWKYVQPVDELPECKRGKSDGIE